VEPALISIKHYVDLLVQGVVLVVPIVATWFARTYVRGETGEKRLAQLPRSPADSCHRRAVSPRDVVGAPSHRPNSD